MKISYICIFSLVAMKIVVMHLILFNIYTPDPIIVISDTIFLGLMGIYFAIKEVSDDE